VLALFAFFLRGKQQDMVAEWIPVLPFVLRNIREEMSWHIVRAEHLKEN